jgi:hypothetical protein
VDRTFRNDLLLMFAAFLTYDDDLSKFEADGAAPLPVANDRGYVERDGARIWYATYGSGSPVILLHGGLGHSGIASMMNSSSVNTPNISLGAFQMRNWSIYTV